MEQGSKYQNYYGVRVMVFKHHFQQYFNYMVVSFIGEGNRSTGENHQPATSHRQTLLHNVVSSTPHHEQDYNSHDIHLNTLKLHVRTSVMAMLDFRLAITIYNIFAWSVCTWWMLFQKHVVCTKFDIYVFMTEGFIMIF